MEIPKWKKRRNDIYLLSDDVNGMIAKAKEGEGFPVGNSSGRSRLAGRSFANGTKWRKFSRARSGTRRGEGSLAECNTRGGPASK